MRTARRQSWLLGLLALLLLCAGCDLKMGANDYLGTAQPEATDEGQTQPEDSDASADRSVDGSGQAPTDSGGDGAQVADDASLANGSASSGAQNAPATCPTGAVRVNAGESVQSAIERAGQNGVVCIAPGTYRLTRALRPKAGSMLHFADGAVLNGSRTINSWSRSGSNWVARSQTQSFQPPQEVRCGSDSPTCEFEDVFLNGRPLTRVGSLSELRRGRVLFDEDANRIHIADDPAGQRVEATVAATAIEAPGVPGVTVHGATVEKFALDGIVTSRAWRLTDNEIRYVHGHGIRAYGGTHVVGNHVHHTGVMGILGAGDGLVFEDNELSYNNYLDFDLWHAGATKITRARNAVVRGNRSHHNTGDGWWFDWDNVNALVEDNVFHDNTRYGLFIEASFSAYIRNNSFRNNGTATKWGGAGLWILSSRDVEVRGNTFEGNKYATLAIASTDRGRADYGQRVTANLSVHDNEFTLDSGFVGVAYGDSSIYSSGANNSFESNIYVVPDRSGEWWRWGSATSSGHQYRDWTGWNRVGNDRNGEITEH